MLSNFLLISSFVLTTFSTSISYSMLGPFYSVIALERGINETISGLTFGAFGIVMFLVCPITGKYIIPRYGPKRIAIIGILISSLGNLMFGFLNNLKSKYFFIILSLALRCAIAFGSSLYLTSEFTMVLTIFPGSVGSVIVGLVIYFRCFHYSPLYKGILETAVGLGVTIGPIFGGFLYDNISFEAPFLLIFLIQMLLFGYLIWRLPCIESMKFQSNHFLINFIRSGKANRRLFSLFEITTNSSHLCEHRNPCFSN
jgi:MFS family permease